MKTFKKIFTVILLLFIIVFSISLLANFTVVVPITKAAEVSVKSVVEGDTINPLKNFDLNKGHWSAYISLSSNDFEELDPLIKRANCLKTTDIKVLKRIQKDWKLLVSNADISTVESSIYFFNDDKLVFESGIVLDKNQEGLQNTNYGWLVPSSSGTIIEDCRKFKKVYWPLVFL